MSYVNATGKEETFIVYSHGRTASTLITANINHYCNINRPWINEVWAVHNPKFIHSNSFIPLTDHTTCILSRRFDLIESVLSHIVLNRTYEPALYSNKHVDKFTVNLNTFKQIFQSYHEFYDRIDLTQYEKVITMWYGPVINDPMYLFSKLGIVRKTDLTLVGKSPYNYYTLIENIDEILNYVQEMRTSVLTTGDIYK